MAGRKKTVKNNSTSGEPLIPVEKKRKMLGIFMSVFSLLIFLSILSYSRFDQANLTYSFTDMFKVFTADPEFVQRAESTHNWLGLFGAYISSFFINSTIGYFALAFPVALFLWALTIFKDEAKRQPFFYTNFILVMALVLASFTGMLQYEFAMLTDFTEASGKVGAFFGTAIGRLFGGLGGIIFFVTVIALTIFLTFDVKLDSITALIADIFKGDEENKKERRERPERNVPADDQPVVNMPEEEEPATDFISDNDFITDDDFEEIEPDENDSPNVKIIQDIIAEELGTPEEQPKQDDEVTININLDDEPVEEEIEFTGDDDLPVENLNTDDLTGKIEFETDHIEEKEDDSKSRDVIVEEIDRSKEAKLPEQWEENLKYKLPDVTILNESSGITLNVSREELQLKASQLKEKLNQFNIDIVDISVQPGPVLTLYIIVPSPDVKISRIVGLQDDIAMALAAKGIRIIAPIPGKSAIGVEIPNKKPSLVSASMVIKRLLGEEAILPLAFGKTITGEDYHGDLADMPHLLIAGSTGSGKSVGINMFLTSLLYTKKPNEVKFAIIDPKKVELSFYKKLNKHYLAISPDIDEQIITTAQNALLLLKSVLVEMDDRYTKFAKVGARNIHEYNKKFDDGVLKQSEIHGVLHHKLPYIVLIIDELADLMMTSGKEVEEPIARLAQLARAVGIHMIVATQRPSVNVITGIIKANFPARIAYRVASKVDSRTIIDKNGAEQLLGRGDMLVVPGNSQHPIRVQNAFISTEEVERLTDFVYQQRGFSKPYYLPSVFEKQTDEQGSIKADLDPMFADAARVIVVHQQGSVSLLQRRLSLGYARAARIVDQLESCRIVGPSMGSKARDVLVDSEEELEEILRTL